MTFELATADALLSENHLIVVERVDDVGKHPGTEILFQFPPMIKSDKKEGKWKEMNNTLGYEPKYMYEGAKPRSISIEATYVVGGPVISGASGAGATIADVLNQIRTWKKYFYFSSFTGGGGQQGGSLPIWRISYMGGPGGLISLGGGGSSWRCMNYNVKYSDTWVTDNIGCSHPLISTISMELQMATGVDVTGNGDPKQDMTNIDNKPSAEWY